MKNTIKMFNLMIRDILKREVIDFCFLCFKIYIFTSQKKPYPLTPNEALRPSWQPCHNGFPSFFQRNDELQEQLGTTAQLQIFQGHKWCLRTLTIKQTLDLTKSFLAILFGHIQSLHPWIHHWFWSVTVIGFGLSDPIFSLPNCGVLSPNKLTKVLEDRHWVPLIFATPEGLV